ncbi:MAG: tetratricopeptide repeat protein [Ignavibacteriae bacterium]|nr:tetratricopeptide repeat protein [Ignavibacteriota bacterium]
MFRCCRIKYTCIIIITILVILGLNGCSISRSVRQGSRTSVKKPVTEQNSASLNQDENRQDALSDAEFAIHSDSVNNTNSITKIPTLNQQLKTLTEEQQVMKQTISGMQNDITEIKSTLADIKNALSNSLPLPQEAVKGIIPENNNIVKSNIILPDETVKKQDLQQQEVRQIEKPKSKPVIFKKKPVQTTSNAIKYINNPKPELKPVTQKINSDDRTEASTENITFTSVEKDLNTKNYQDAIRKLIKLVAIERDPEQINNYNFLLGESHFGLKQYQEAIAYYRKVIASRLPLKKDNAQIMLAEAQVKSGRIDEARKAYQVFVEKYPTSEFLPKARKMLQQL